MPRVRAAVALALTALALAPVGCGGGEVAKKPKQHPRTERTAPRITTVPTTPRATPQAPSSTSQDPATAPAPQGEGDGRPGATPQGGADSPQNDTPPPPGSPADRFEQDCRAQKSCG